MSLSSEFLRDIQRITIMSDRQKGLVNVLETHWPNTNRRHCAKHVYANFRKKFLGKLLRNLFQAVSKAENQIDFIQPLNDVKVVDENADKWILKNDVPIG